MPQFRQYPSVVSLEATDAILLDRIGVGTVYAEEDILSESILAQAVGYVPWTSAINPLVGNTKYLIPTASSAPSLYLPALSSVSIGTVIVTRDQDDYAGVNNITVHASGADVIFDHATSASTFVQRISNTIAEFVAQATGWRAIVYGG